MSSVERKCRKDYSVAAYCEGAQDMAGQFNRRDFAFRAGVIAAGVGIASDAYGTDFQ
jgi:hypothetical protein